MPSNRLQSVGVKTSPAVEEPVVPDQTRDRTRMGSLRNSLAAAVLTAISTAACSSGQEEHGLISAEPWQSEASENTNQAPRLMLALEGEEGKERDFKLILFHVRGQLFEFTVHPTNNIADVVTVSTDGESEVDIGGTFQQIPEKQQTQVLMTDPATGEDEKIIVNARYVIDKVEDKNTNKVVKVSDPAIPGGIRGVSYLE